jgi:hypothetical protein
MAFHGSARNVLCWSDGRGVTRARAASYFEGIESFLSPLGPYRVALWKRIVQIFSSPNLSEELPFSERFLHVSYSTV